MGTISIFLIFNLFFGLQVQSRPVLPKAGLSSFLSRTIAEIFIFEYVFFPPILGTMHHFIKSNDQLSQCGMALFAHLTRTFFPCTAELTWKSPLKPLTKSFKHQQPSRHFHPSWHTHAKVIQACWHVFCFSIPGLFLKGREGGGWFCI